MRRKIFAVVFNMDNNRHFWLVVPPPWVLGTVNSIAPRLKWRYFNERREEFTELLRDWPGWLERDGKFTSWPQPCTISVLYHVEWDTRIFTWRFRGLYEWEDWVSIPLLQKHCILTRVVPSQTSRPDIWIFPVLYAGIWPLASQLFRMTSDLGAWSTSPLRQQSSC